MTAVRRAGIADFRFHDLRHMPPPTLVMRGGSLKEVQEVLGHRDFKMTVLYAQPSPSHLRTAVERLKGLMPGARPDPPPCHIAWHIGL
jgi:site-specific recombinase XerD